MSDQFALAQSPRLRRSPYYDSTVRAGVKRFSVYNHMLLPAGYTGPHDEYRALVEDVTIWDVAAQRQVEVTGPDAEALVDYVCTRDVLAIAPGTARYTFVCNHEGGILNDPVLLRLDADHFWLSLADRDILLWVEAIAAERGFDVQVCEPDVSPLQVQGPRSRDLIRDLLGDDYADLGYFRVKEAMLDGIPLVVSHTGWSGELGYELYLRDGSRGNELWDMVFDAGDRHGAKPAAPNQIRRIEGGMLSYGTDVDDSTTPYEMGWGRLVALETGRDFAGRSALERAAQQPPARAFIGARFGGSEVGATPVREPVLADGAQIGVATSMAYSPRLTSNIALLLVDRKWATADRELHVGTSDGLRSATTEALPFVAPTKT